jgi:hypothetical protein
VAIPTWVDTHVLPASDCNTWFTPIVAIKSSDEPRSSNSPSADSDLQIALGASSTYRIRGQIYWGCGAAGGGLKWAFTAPSGASGFYSPHPSDPGTPETALTWTTTYTFAFLGTAVAFGLNGHLVTTGAGTLQLSWSRNVTGDGSATTVKQYSFIVAVRIS